MEPRVPRVLSWWLCCVRNPPSPPHLQDGSQTQLSLSWRSWVWAEHALGWTRARGRLRPEGRGAPPAPQGPVPPGGLWLAEDFPPLMTQAATFSCSLLLPFRCRSSFSLSSYLLAVLCARDSASPWGSLPSRLLPCSTAPLPPSGGEHLRASAICRLTPLGL